MPNDKQLQEKNMQIDILPPELTAISVYQGRPVTEIIAHVEKSAKQEAAQYEITTDKGRKALASVAYKVAKSKTFLDDLGKEMVEDWKAAAKKVDADRKLIRDSLDALKEEVRKPLTDWENAEKERVASREARITEIRAFKAAIYNSTADVKNALDALNALAQFDWMEFADTAQEAAAASLVALQEKLQSLLQAEAERAELEKLRLETAVREQKEREERIAREAAEAATKAAEAAAKIAADKAEALRLEAVAQADRARRDAELAVQREREKIDAEKKAAEAAEQKRAADIEHRKKINNEALQAFIACGLSEDAAKKAVLAIANGSIPNINIKY